MAVRSVPDFKIDHSPALVLDRAHHTCRRRKSHSHPSTIHGAVIHVQPCSVVIDTAARNTASTRYYTALAARDPSIATATDVNRANKPKRPLAAGILVAPSAHTCSTLTCTADHSHLLQWRPGGHCCASPAREWPAS